MRDKVGIIAVGIVLVLILASLVSNHDFYPPLED